MIIFCHSKKKKYDRKSVDDSLKGYKTEYPIYGGANLEHVLCFVFTITLSIFGLKDQSIYGDFLGSTM